tara:strand:+ start:872 stop:1204 length:333 start_codon:yes stop_codon:yes gene_type:complete
MPAIFCPKCENIMRPKKEKGKLYLVCSCGYKRLSGKKQTVFKEQVKTRVKKIEAIESKNYLATYPHVCKKCGYDKAELILFEPWWGDEDSVVRYKCGKCGKVEHGLGKVM